MITFVLVYLALGILWVAMCAAIWPLSVIRYTAALAIVGLMIVVIVAAAAA